VEAFMNHPSCNINEKFDNGESVLHKAIKACVTWKSNRRKTEVYKDMKQLVTKLLEKGANSNILDDDGFSPLLISAKFNFFSLASQMANQKEANPNVVDPSTGRTALHYAHINFSRKKKGSLIDILNINRADSTIKDFSGKTAIEYAPMVSQLAPLPVSTKKKESKHTLPHNLEEKLLAELNGGPFDDMMLNHPMLYSSSDDEDDDSDSDDSEEVFGFDPEEYGSTPDPY